MWILSVWWFAGWFSLLGLESRWEFGFDEDEIEIYCLGFDKVGCLAASSCFC
jgi:hypothetical protein